jgi:4-hydroxybenzoate polyprenyltransferase
MFQKIRDLAITSRPISWINTAYPFAVGYIVTQHHIDWRLIVGSVFFLIPYNLLVYGINDVFDYESDIANPRKGGVEGAVLERSRHRLVLQASIGLCVPFVAALIATGSIASKLWLIYLLFMAVAYSAPYLRFKEYPFLDSFTSATHFVSPLVYAFLLVGWHASDWPYVLAFFLWALASTGYYC